MKWIALKGLAVLGDQPAPVLHAGRYGVDVHRRRGVLEDGHVRLADNRQALDGVDAILEASDVAHRVPDQTHVSLLAQVHHHRPGGGDGASSTAAGDGGRDVVSLRSLGRPWTIIIGLRSSISPTSECAATPESNSPYPVIPSSVRTAENS